MICQVIETVSGKDQGNEIWRHFYILEGIARQVIQVCFPWGVVNSLCVQLSLCKHGLLSQKRIIITYIIILCIDVHIYIDTRIHISTHIRTHL